jgi:lipoprotein-releasing system permease protein
MTQVAVFLPGRDYVQPGALFGIEPEWDGPPMTVIQRQVRSGELEFGPTRTGYPPLLMGRRLADKLGIFPGDTVTVASFENMRYGPMGPMPAMALFEVTDRFTTGMYDYDSEHMYAPMDAAQALLDLGTGVSGVGVNISDPWQADAVARWLQNELPFPFYTNDWMQLNATLFSALQLEKLAMAIILFLIVVVAAFNIISTLIMVVADKTREIGILKSMGITDRTVLGIFMLQGLTIGLVGTGLGVALGLFLIWLLDTYQFIELPGDVYFLDTLPVALDPRDLGIIVVLSILVAFAATIYPAWQASRLLPVDAIRHE